MGDHTGEGGEKFGDGVEVEILIGDSENDSERNNGVEDHERQAVTDADHDSLGAIDDIAGELVIAECPCANIGEANDDAGRQCAKKWRIKKRIAQYSKKDGLEEKCTAESENADGEEFVSSGITAMEVAGEHGGCAERNNGEG